MGNHFVSCRQKISQTILDFFKHTWMSGKRKKKDIVKEIGPFNRVLTTTDATILSISSGLSSFLYTSLIINTVNYGPIMTLAVIIAAIISIITSISYAEMMAKVPAMGSSYHYTYCYIGEYPGFMVGWSGVFNYFIGFASMVLGCSKLLDDTFFDGVLSKLCTEKMPLLKDSLIVQPAVNVVSFFVAIAFAGTVGAKPNESKIANNWFAILNLCALTIMVVLLSGQARFGNIGFEKNKFALKGPMSIFPTVVHSLVYFRGTESLALLGDEIKNPHVALPRGIFYSMTVSCFYYIGISFLFALVVNYNNKDLNTWVDLLKSINLEEPSWVPKIGSLCAVYCTIFSSLFWLTRLVYAMGRDGLFLHIFARMAHSTSVPVATAFILATFGGLVATFLYPTYFMELELFTLLIMNLMAPICVLVSRYCAGTDMGEQGTGARMIFVNHPYVHTPTNVTEQISSVLIGVILISLALMSHIGMGFLDEKENTNLTKTLLILVVILFFGALYCLFRQPQHETEYFKMCCVPLLPCINILLIFGVMDHLLYKVWKSLLGYFFLGTVFYLSYSMNNSDADFEHGLGKFYTLTNKTRLPQPIIKEKVATSIKIDMKKMFLHRASHM